MECQLNQLGLEFIKSITNFILIKISSKDLSLSDKAVAFFKEKGLLVRGMNVYNLPLYIRVSFGTEEENQYFIKILKEFLSLKNGN